jgi:hypothetical protein
MLILVGENPAAHASDQTAFMVDHKEESDVPAAA